MANRDAGTVRFVVIGVRFGGAEYEKGFRVRLGSAHDHLHLCVTSH